MASLRLSLVTDELTVAWRQAVRRSRGRGGNAHVLTGPTIHRGDVGPAAFRLSQSARPANDQTLVRPQASAMARPNGIPVLGQTFDMLIDCLHIP